MAEYMFLLFDDESWYDEITPEKWESAMKIHGEFAEAVEAAGAKILDGRALERTTTATTITRDWDNLDAAAVVTDGPFIETKEALGGYYLIPARDLDQALELARLCPSGHTEVRPVMDTSGNPASAATRPTGGDTMAQYLFALYGAEDWYDSPPTSGRPTWSSTTSSSRRSRRPGQRSSRVRRCSHSRPLRSPTTAATDQS